MYEKNSLQLQAYNSLKELILNKDLKADELYSETRLARELGISRTPLREALQCLSQDGYITIIPSRGFRIRELDETSMRESIQVRCAIEGFCVHLIAAQTEERKAQKLLKELEKSLLMQKKALDAGDSTERFIEADHAFHLHLVHYAENEEFNHLYQRLMHMIQLTSVNALNVSGRARATYEEHENLYQYLKEGNGDYAYQLLIAHLLMPLNMKLV